MTALFINILSMSLTASIVTLAVLFVRFPLSKAPKTFSYALWSVVLFRLIFPFSIQSIFGLMPTSANIIPQDIISLPLPMVQQTAVQLPAAIPTIPLAQESTFAITPIHIATCIWLFGFIILLIYAAVGYIRLKRRTRFATLVQDNIYETDQIETPFVLGLIRPKIYFPVATCHHDYIVKHEQIHIKRLDYIVKPLAFIVLALHWFNPLMWAAYILMSKDMEMSCDEAVLRSADEDVRRAYSMSLLNLSVKRASLLSPIAFGESNVKGRVRNVLRFKKPAKWLTAISFVAVAAFLVGFMFDGYTTNRPVYSVTNYNVNAFGWRVADANETEEITRSILSKYFSAFISDWSSWDITTASLSLIENAQWPDDEGNIPVIDIWFGRVSDDVVDEHRIFTPPLIYYFNDATGELLNVIYSPPIKFTAANHSPFAVSFAEAFETNQFYPFPTEFMTDTYRNMLLEVATQHTRAAGFAAVAENISYIQWFAFDGLLLSVIVDVTAASGDNAQFTFWVSEEGFALVGFRLDFN